MNFPKVSVIIPNYNHARFLMQRIESVINQTYKNFDITILDDFSTDNSREVIEAYRSHPNVKNIIYNSTNSGSAFKQWERGIELADGDWIWIAESDDYADVGFLDIMMEMLSKTSGIGLAYCDSFISDVDGLVKSESFKDIKNKRYLTARWSSNYRNSGLNELSDWFIPEGTINNTSAVLFNKEVLMKANPFDLNLKYIGDKYAFLKVMAISDVLYVCKSLNYYRDPFNTKYANKITPIFHEQFLIFNWIEKAQVLSRKKFWRAFFFSARISLFKNWDLTKWTILKNLCFVNWRLFSAALAYNIVYPILARLKK